MRRNKNKDYRKKARKGNLKNIFLKGTVATGVMLGGAAMYDNGNVVYAAESESTTDLAEPETVLDEGASTSTMESQSVAEPTSEADSETNESAASEVSGVDASESSQSVSSEAGGTETSASSELTASESAQDAASASAMQSTAVSEAQSGVCQQGGGIRDSVCFRCPQHGEC